MYVKIAVLTDSTAYIPASIRDQWNVHMVPLNVSFGNESYREEIDLTTDEFYEMIRDAKDLPKTSQPSIGALTSIYEELAKDYDAVISIHLSSGISGTYQSAVAAGNMVEDLEVYPYDSEISAMAQGHYVLEAAAMAEQRASVEEILARLDEMKQSIRAYFMVDDLSNLHRGGRLNGAQVLVGSMLQVKPLLHFVDKKIVPFEKIRTKKRALNRIQDLFAKDADTGVPIKATVIHAQRQQDAEKFKQELEAKYDNAEVSISYFGPVIGTHLGEGAIGLAWYKK